MQSPHSPAIIWLLLVASSLSLAFAPQGDKAGEPRRVVVRGQVVCHDDAGHSCRQERDCTQSPCHYRFTTTDGTSYQFVATDSAVAMFADPQVRAQRLQLTALLRPQGRLEIIQIQSVRGDELYDLYYFCEVCNITEYAPGPCTCCREPLELRVSPASRP